ncbi:carboxylesterase family protein [Streptococcus loxodontisalivarius]|uniref:Peptidase n=1 Tax=Streptococcus loxodontisalivarius TaxID=1349415 RepID=A0ABS2PW61_9STRE|nr:PHB depolymerase family esterase [Streptococcus loxodontisalivarius]MBM7643522.1 putative peptidase [Streptococcus loxodontisalivarius]
MKKMKDNSAKQKKCKWSTKKKWTIALSGIAATTGLAIGGLMYSGFWSMMFKSSEINTVIKENSSKFETLTFTDESGQTLTYNLYIPENYDSSKSYPLVLFLHDSASVSDNATYTLEQGVGADVWASDEVQDYSQAFVLAPQFNEVIANDDFELTGQGELIVPLIESLKKDYSLDSNRIYTTGQSMGSMTSMALNVKYPNYFAASYFVTGQWDEKSMEQLADSNTKMTWIVSEGDAKAWPVMETMKNYMNEKGISYATDIWDGRWTSTEYDQATEELYSQEKNINLVTYAAGTVMPSYAMKSATNEHIYTWYKAYLISGVQKWLLSQTLDGSGQE